MDYSCVGIDFDGNNAVVSYLNKEDSEPTTVSVVVGKEEFMIPICVVKKRGIGQWLYGKEAIAYSKDNDVPCQWDLLKRAENDETVVIEEREYNLVDLFYFFLKKLLALPAKYGGTYNYEYIILSVENITMKNMQMFWICMEKMKFPLNNLIVMDHRESFCNYSLYQKEELTKNQIGMFEFKDNTLTTRILIKNRKQIPNTVSVMEDTVDYDGSDKDLFFLTVAKDNLVGKVLSAVYLTGDGFEGDWMKQSLKFLCTGRRVFMGRNLYSKGCCFGPDRNKDFIFLGENELKCNVSLKVSENGSYKFIPLIEAGKNWYDVEHEYELILRGEQEIDFWIQPVSSNKPKIITYVLKDWPVKKNNITRVRINAKPISQEEVRITMKDMGFGEISPASDARSEYILKLE